MDECFIMDGLQEQISATIKQLDEMGKEIKDNVCKEAVTKAAPVLLDEEIRLLQKAPNFPRFKAISPSMLMSRVYKNKDGAYIAQCGYNTETIEQHIEVLILEFGRPGNGKRSVKKGGIDKIGRKIGVVQPYSHIRAAMYNKKDELRELVGSYVLDEAERLWKKNG